MRPNYFARFKSNHFYKMMATHLRVPYDACVVHIHQNLRNNLSFRMMRSDIPGVVHVMPLGSIKSMSITEMMENRCGTTDCLSGILTYEHEEYRFVTRQDPNVVALMMEMTKYPFHHAMLVLPITLSADHSWDKIHIPVEYTTEDHVIPLEIVWEFLSQLPAYTKGEISLD